MSSSTAFTVKTLLIFLIYIFEFFINKTLLDLNSIYLQLKIVNLTQMFNTWCCGTIDIAMTLHVNGLGFRLPPEETFFFLFFLFWSFCFCFLSLVYFFFFLHIFIFLTDLKSTGRLTASLLSAFIKIIFIIIIINPWVSQRHPLICFWALLGFQFQIYSLLIYWDKLGLRTFEEYTYPKFTRCTPVLCLWYMY